MRKRQRTSNRLRILSSKPIGELLEDRRLLAGDLVLENGLYQTEADARVTANPSIVLHSRGEIGQDLTGFSLQVSQRQNTPAWSAWTSNSQLNSAASRQPLPSPIQFVCPTEDCSVESDAYRATFTGTVGTEYRFRWVQGGEVASNVTHVSLTGENKGVGKSYVILDFTPDEIPNEIQPQSFFDLFSEPTRPGEFHHLNRDGDGDIDQQDAALFVEDIQLEVKRRLEPLGFEVRAIRGATDDDNAGQVLLNGSQEFDFAGGRNRDDVNTYVVYLGGAIADSTETIGIAQCLGAVGENCESYAYAFTDRISSDLDAARRVAFGRNRNGGQLPTGQVNQVGNQWRVSLSDGVQVPQDVRNQDNLQLLAFIPDPVSSAVRRVVIPVQEFNDSGQIILPSPLVLEIETSLQEWQTAGNVPFKILETVPPSPTDFVTAIGHTVQHELGHLLGLQHPLRPIPPDGPIQGFNLTHAFEPANVMSYNSMYQLSRFTDDSRFPAIAYSLPFGELYPVTQPQLQEALASLEFDSTTNQFVQLSRPNSNPATPTVLAGLSEDEAGNGRPSDFLELEPEQATPPAATMGTVSASTTPASVISELDQGFTALRNDVLAGITSLLDLQSDWPILSSKLAETLGLQDLIAGAVGDLELGANSMADLQEELVGLGFQIQHFTSDVEFGALTQGAPADLVRATRNIPIGQIAETLDFDAADLPGLGALQQFDLSGNLDINGDVVLSVAVGVDTAGFYLVPGEMILANVTANGNIMADTLGLLSADATAYASALPTVTLKTDAVDGRIRLSDLSPANLAEHATADVNGTAGVEVDLSLENPAAPANPIEFGGKWFWDFDVDGFALDEINSGLYENELKESLLTLVGGGIDQLGNAADSLLASASIPVLGDGLADAFERQFTCSANAPFRLEYCEQLGLSVELAVPVEDLVDAAIGGSLGAQDLLRVSIDTIATEDFSVPIGGELQLGPITASIESTAERISPTFETRLDLGFDTIGGLYIVEGGTFDLGVNGEVADRLVGNAAITNIASASIETGLSAKLRLTKVIDNQTGPNNERLYFGSAALTNTWSDISTLSFDGALTLDDLQLSGTLEPLANLWFGEDAAAIANVSLSATNAAFSWNGTRLAPQVGLTWDNRALQNSVAELLLSGVNVLGEQAGAIAAFTEDIPLIGKQLRKGIAGGRNLEDVVGDALSFEPANGQSALEYLAANGFEVLPGSGQLTVDNILDGTGLSGELLRVRYTRDVRGDVIDVPTQSLQLGDDGSLLDLSLEGTLQVDAGLDFDITFGLDALRGPFVVESTNAPAVSGTFELNGAVDGTARVGNLLNLGATLTSGDSDFGASFRLTDGDGVDGERLFLLGNDAETFTIAESLAEESDRDRAVSLSGRLEVDAALTMSNPASQIELVGEFLPEEFTWTAEGFYDLLTEENGFQVKQDANLQTIIDILSGSRDDAMARFLGYVDQYNPLPEIVRNALTRPIPLVNKTILEMAGAEQFEIIINPHKFAEKSEAEVNEERGVQVNIDIAKPENVLAILSGKTADLISFSFEDDIELANLIFPVIPNTPLFSFLGLINVDVVGSLTFGAELGVNFRAGFDTNGFFLDDGQLISITGSPGIRADVTGRVGPVPLAEVDLDAMLPIEISAGLTSPQGNGKVRFNEILSAEQSLGLTIALELGVEVGVGFPKIGDPNELDDTLSLSTGRLPARVVLYEGTKSVGSIEDQLADLKRRIGEKADEAAELACVAGAVTGNVLIAAIGCGAAYGDEILQAAADFDRWRLETQEKAEREVGKIVEGAKEWAGDRAEEAKQAGRNFDRFVLQPLGRGVDFVLEQAGVPADVFGKGEWEQKIPRKLFSYEHALSTDGKTLVVNWTDGDRNWVDANRNSGTGAELTVGIQDGKVIVDGPDFVTRELVAERKYDCWDGCNKERREVDFVQFNTAEYPIDRIERVVLNGTDRDDQLFGDSSISIPLTLNGLGGNDFLVGGRGDDLIRGGSGDDDISGRFGDDELYGGPDDDLIVGDLGEDRLYGGSGNDTLDARTADDSGTGRASGAVPQNRPNEENYAFGGSGSDIIIGGAGRDHLEGGANDDQIDGGGGPDTIYGDSGNDFIEGGSGNDTINGGTGNDTLIGDAGDDTISGNEDNDSIYGDDREGNRFGNDTLRGDAGFDTIDGGRGRDEIEGGADADLLRGGSGNDTIHGATFANPNLPTNGNDTIFGDGDDDRLFSGISGPGRSNYPNSTRVGRTLIDGGSGEDKLYGSNGPEELIGGDDNDEIFGFGGADTLIGVAGSDLLHGGDGNDTIFASYDASSATQVLIACGNGDFCSRVEDVTTATGSTVYGGDGEDQIAGSLGRDTIFGGDDDDTIAGGQGDDIIRSEAGDDTVYGDDGDDQIHGGDGEDELFAGDGEDQVWGNGERDTIRGGGQRDQLFGGDGNDDIDGENGNDLIRGGDGVDEISGGAGDDELWGEEDRDIIRGGPNDDVIRGEEGNDDLDGGSGDDEIYGGVGIDTIRGGLGSDEIFGGAGGDTLYAGTNELGGGNSNDSNTIFADPQGTELDPMGNTYTNTIYGDIGPDALIGGATRDVIRGLAGNDFIVGNMGDDELYGGPGFDIAFGGMATFASSDLNPNEPGHFEPFPRFEAFDFSSIDGPRPDSMLVPIVVGGTSVEGLAADGRDVIHGGGDKDWLFGGGDQDELLGEGGNDYIDGGSGAELILLGGPGNDIVVGGSGDDELRGGSGLDLLFGNAGDDDLYGDAGVNDSQAGQILFGGDDNDRLYAYAGSANAAAENSREGDQLIGGTGDDELFGNIRLETLVGGPGRDWLSGDALAGPGYAPNPSAEITGANDRLDGGPGDDRLLGGGGNDALLGGPDSDYLEGQNGQDQLLGGAGIDAIVVDVDPRYASLSDTVDGHGTTGADVDTDILLFAGTDRNDFIRVSERTSSDVSQKTLLFEVAELPAGTHPSQADPNQVNFREVPVVWRNEGGPLIEQIQIMARDGDDRVEFVNGSEAVDVELLSQRSRDYIAVVDAGAGDDYVVGTAGRDRIDGGPGSDTLFGREGDDRLWGDSALGNASDHDTLYAGQGNDDAIGGIGTNALYAWSQDPSAGATFGVFVDSMGQIYDDRQQDISLPEIDSISRISGLTIDSTTHVDRFSIPSSSFRITDEIAILSSSGSELVVEAFVNGERFAREVVPQSVETSVPFSALAGQVGTVELRVTALAETRADETIEYELSPRFGLPEAERNRVLDLSRQWENTGLNRLLGNIQTDLLYGGTGLDFMYGNGSNAEPDQLFDRYGRPFGSRDAGLGGDVWKEYAQTASSVWYYNATNIDDSVAVDFVTEPGLLEGRHLITRLTENDDNFSFDAQVQLDFQATKDDGQFVWNPSDATYAYAISSALISDLGAFGGEVQFSISLFDSPPVEITVPRLGGEATLSDFVAALNQSLQSAGATEVSAAVSTVNSPGEQTAFQIQLQTPGIDPTSGRTNSPLVITDANDIARDRLNFRKGTQAVFELSQPTSLEAILPAEGAFDAIIIDTLDGDDRVSVGPTVLKSVWADGGLGDDIIQVEPGRPILTDQAELPQRNDSAETASRALLSTIDFEEGSTYTGLTLDNPADEDWFVISLPSPDDEGVITLSSLSSQDRLSLRVVDLATGIVLGAANSPGATQRLPLEQLDADGDGSNSLQPITTGDYWLQITSDRTPTIYELSFSSSDPVANNEVSLANELLNGEERRDVLLGGPGHDILSGGAFEDWIFGQAGNDVLAGGADQQASDLLFGGEGNDKLQIIPDEQTLGTTQSDRFDGGPGTDQAVFLGGDVDELGRPIADQVAVSYNANTDTYRVAARPFADDPNAEWLHASFEVANSSFGAPTIESFEIDVQAGNDEVRADPGYLIGDSEWGLSDRDRVQGARLIDLIIRGGDGNDQLFGGAGNDLIHGGNGDDAISGGEGDDQLFGGPGSDVVSGNEEIGPDRYEFQGQGTRTTKNDMVTSAALIPTVQPGSVISGLTFHPTDTVDWYAFSTPLASQRFGQSEKAYVTGDMFKAVPKGTDSNIELQLYRASVTNDTFEIAVEQQGTVPDYYLLRAVKPEGEFSLEYEIRVNATLDSTIHVAPQPGTAQGVSVETTFVATPTALSLDGNSQLTAPAASQQFGNAVDELEWQEALSEYSDDFSSLFVDDANQKVYWVLDGTIYRSDFDGGRQEVVYTRADTDAQDLTIDVANQIAYWTSGRGAPSDPFDSSSIRRANLNTDQSPQTVFNRVGNSSGIADFVLVGDRLYWVENELFNTPTGQREESIFYSGRTNGTSRSTLRTFGGSTRRGSVEAMAYDPASQQIYWGNFESRPEPLIQRAPLDFSTVQTVLRGDDLNDTSCGQFSACVVFSELMIDTKNRRLVWADRRGRLSSSTINGGDVNLRLHSQLGGSSNLSYSGGAVGLSSEYGQLFAVGDTTYGGRLQGVGLDGRNMTFLAGPPDANQFVDDTRLYLHTFTSRPQDISISGGGSSIALPAPLTGSAFGSQSRIATGDFDGDGNQDLAVVVSSTLNFGSIFENSGLYLVFDVASIEGTFHLVDDSTQRIERFHSEVRSFKNLGDINGDGADDLLLTYGDQSVDTTVVFGGRRDAWLENDNPITRFPTWTNAWGVGNFNGDDDNQNDLVVQQNGSLGFYLDRSTNFTSPNYSADFGTSSRIAAIGDVDNDGRADIAVYDNSEVNVVFGTADTSGETVFLPQNVVEIGLLAGRFIRDVLPLGDIDGSGADFGVLLDGGALLAYRGGSERQNLEWKHPGLVFEVSNTNQALSFAPSDLIATSLSTNNDQLADIAIAEPVGGSLQIFHGQPTLPAAMETSGGPEGLSRTLNYPLAVPQNDVETEGESSWTLPGAQPRKLIASGDLNGDHREDFVITNASTSVAGESYLFYGPFEGSLDFDLALTADVIFDGSLGTVASTPGDFNGDGVNDLLFVGTSSIHLTSGRQLANSPIPRVITESTVAANGSPIAQELYRGFDLNAGFINWNGDAFSDLYVIQEDEVYFADGRALSDSMRIDGPAMQLPLATTDEIRDFLDDEDINDFNVGSLKAPATAEVVGDVNGDGLDDLLILQPEYASLEQTRRTIDLGRGLLFYGGGAFPDDVSEAGNSFVGVGLKKVQALGDINQDAFADFALQREVEASNQASALVYFGSESLTSPAPAEITNPLDADLEIRRSGRGFLNERTFIRGPLHLTTGDYDRDGKIDLVAGQPERYLAIRALASAEFQDISANRSGNVFIIDAIGDRRGTVTLNEASLAGSNRQEVGRLEVTPNIDLNADGLADLVVGSLTEAGTALAVNVINRDSQTLPDVEALNAATPPVVFDSIGRTEEKWYQLQLLGDGQPGNHLYVTEPDAGPRPTSPFRFDVIDSDGKTIAVDKTLFDLRDLDVGIYLMRVYVRRGIDTTESLEFRLDLNLPREGETRRRFERSDRDLLRGGEGEDLLIGNEDVDRIFGDSGNDIFQASQSEVRDRTFEINSTRLEAIVSFAEAGRTNEQGPLIADELDPLVSSAFADPDFLVLISRQLGRSASTLRESDLAELDELRLDGQNFVSLAGLEYATNLRWLSARSTNNADQIFQLRDRLPHLRYLDLANNEIANLPSFQTDEWTNLEYLDLSSNAITSTSELESLVSLHELRLAGNPVAEQVVQRIEATVNGSILAGPVEVGTRIAFTALPIFVGDEIITSYEWKVQDTEGTILAVLPQQQQVFYEPSFAGLLQVQMVINTDRRVLTKSFAFEVVGSPDLLGDLDQDGSVDGADLDRLTQALAEQSTDSQFDLNNDGVVDRADLDLMLDTLTIIPGDLDLDGIVAFSDFLVLSGNFGRDESRWTLGDFTANGKIDFGDFLALSGNFGRTAAAKHRYLRVVADSDVRGRPWTTIGELTLINDAGTELDKSLWSLVFANSQETELEPAPPENAFDGDPDTFWHTEWAPEGNENDPRHPHEIVIDLGGLHALRELQYLPRQDLANGRIGAFRIYLGTDLDDWGYPVAFGELENVPDLARIALNQNLQERVIAASRETLSTPGVADLGAASDSVTYEFFLNFRPGASSVAIAGSEEWAIKFEQNSNAEVFGITQFGVRDYDFQPIDGQSIASQLNYNRDLHVVVVGDKDADETRLYLNGVYSGLLRDVALDFRGNAVLMGARPGRPEPIEVPGEGSLLYHWATFDVALTDEQIRVLSVQALNSV